MGNKHDVKITFALHSDFSAFDEGECSKRLEGVVGLLTDVDFKWKTVGFHSRGCIYCIAEQAVPEIIRGESRRGGRGGRRERRRRARKGIRVKQVDYEP